MRVMFEKEVEISVDAPNDRFYYKRAFDDSEPVSLQEIKVDYTKNNLRKSVVNFFKPKETSPITIKNIVKQNKVKFKPDRLLNLKHWMEK